MTTISYKSKDEELKILKTVVGSIESQVNSFALFHGENSQLDMLLQNVALIFKKQKCSKTNTDVESKTQETGQSSQSSCNSISSYSNNTEIGIMGVSDNANFASISGSGSSSLGKVAESVVSTNNDANGNCDVDIAKDDEKMKIQNLNFEISNLRGVLNQLKLHVSAFAFFAQDCPSLRLFMQNLDLIISKYSTPMPTTSIDFDLRPSVSSLSTLDVSNESNDSIGDMTVPSDPKSVSEVGVLADANPDVDADADTDMTIVIDVNDNSDLDASCMTDMNSEFDVTNNLDTVRDQQVQLYNQPGFSGSNNCKSKRKLDSTTDSPGSDTTSPSKSKKRKRTANANDSSEASFISPISINERVKLIKKEEKERTLTPQQKVFSTDLTMMKIQEYFSVTQLKKIRLVNWRFNIYAIQALRHRESFKVHFKFDWPTKTYVSTSAITTLTTRNNKDDSTAASAPSTLKSLTHFLKTCRDFPCESFTFTHGTLDSEELQEFLNSHGSNIKRIHLDIFLPPEGNNNNNAIPVEGQGQGQGQQQQQQVYPPLASYNEYPTIYLLRNLLVRQLPNLEYLELDNFPKGWKWNSSFERLFPEPKGKEIRLKKLKGIKLPSSTPTRIIDDILAASVNLKEVRSYSNFRPLFKANKFHLMKVLSWCPTPEDIAGFDIDAMPASNLQRFGIILNRVLVDPIFLKRVSLILRNLFESSAGSLHRLCFATPLGYLPDFKIPPLVRVKTIKIGGVSDIASSIQPPNNPDNEGNDNGNGNLNHIQLPQPQLSKKYFPPGFQMGTTFPNLHHVVFEFRNVTKTERWENLFENYKSVPTVKYLDICDKCKYLPVEWMVKFVHLFPNVETLNVQAKYFHFAQDARGIWSFAKLKILRVKINVTASHNQFPAIDSAFTGFTEAVCLNLRENSHSVDLESVEGMREKPSIVNLKALRSLRITFVDPAHVTRIQELPPILTHVTGLFAFQMCKHLRVQVEGKASNKDNSKRLMNALSPIFPYVRSHKML